jgi:Zn finger protein HypA/HybF involved in hydrogenase expression
MQCDDCREVYRADDVKQPCPKCGGKGTVLEDVSEMYGNRAERRKARKAGLPMSKI